MLFVRITLAVAVGAVLVLAPRVVRASKPIPTKPIPKTTGADEACKKWLGDYLRTGSEELVLEDAKVRVLWHKPEKKPGKFLKKKLGKFKGEVYWDSVDSKAGKEVLGCSVMMGMDREVGKQGWIHGVDLYARYDLVKEKEGLRASRVSLVLMLEDNEKTGAIFERPLEECDVGSGSFVPDKLCSIMTIYDTPKGGPDSEIWTTRDITEVLVFTKGGHLSSYSLLGVLEQTDDGVAPIGSVEIETVELGLGKKVLSVREEVVTPVGKGKGDCAEYLVEVTLGYHTLSGGSLVEIFSHVVDVFPDAPCASEAKLDKMVDLVVDVQPVCKGKGPCDLLLEFDQMTPKDHVWSELWRYDGKKYEKVKTMKGDW